MREKTKVQRKFMKMMLASVSHELKQPLNAINYSIDAMARYDSLSDDDPNLVRMKVSIELLLSLIRDITDIAKIDQGAFKLELEKFNLRGVIEEV